MSLIQAPWVVVAAAGALAIGVPMSLLGGTAPRVPTVPPAQPTPLPPIEAGTLAFAVTAPPFDPDRSPEGTAPAGAEAEAEAPPPQPMPALVGLVTGARGRAVALVRGSNGETVTISPGEEVDGWRLVSAGREQAVFELGGNRQTASLDFSNKAGAAAPPPTPAAPSPAPSAPPEGARNP